MIIQSSQQTLNDLLRQSSGVKPEPEIGPTEFDEAFFSEVVVNTADYSPENSAAPVYEQSSQSTQQASAEKPSATQSTQQTQNPNGEPKQTTAQKGAASTQPGAAPTQTAATPTQTTGSTANNKNQSGQEGKGDSKQSGYQANPQTPEARLARVTKEGASQPTTTAAQGDLSQPEAYPLKEVKLAQETGQDPFNPNAPKKQTTTAKNAASKDPTQPETTTEQAQQGAVAAKDPQKAGGKEDPTKTTQATSVAAATEGKKEEKKRVGNSRGISGSMPSKSGDASAQQAVATVFSSAEFMCGDTEAFTDPVNCQQFGGAFSPVENFFRGAKAFLGHNEKGGAHAFRLRKGLEKAGQSEAAVAAALPQAPEVERKVMTVAEGLAFIAKMDQMGGAAFEEDLPSQWQTSPDQVHRASRSNVYSDSSEVRA